MYTHLLLTAILFALASSKPRPNIVIILTDDQDVALGGMTPLSKTRKHLVNEGVTFSNAFSTTPVCCPSRSSILTGLYLHSHGTVNNSLPGGCCDRRWRSRHEGNTFPAVLHRAGYRTFYSGKYLNTYGEKRSGGVAHVPQGWDWWVGLVGNSVYYDYTLSVNGTAVRRGNEVEDYLTDVIREYSLEFLKGTQRPFLMMVAPPAPHEPFTPAERHRGAFAGVKAPRTPNFNIPTNRSKHWLLTLPPDVLPPETIEKIDEVFRNRWETLLSVDELVEAIVLRLRDLQVLNNTYVIFTSDHGFHVGQFGLPWDKRQPYETDIRIPLVVRGPDTFKRTSESPVLNIDLAATVLDMAEMPRKFGDGESFLPRINSVPGGDLHRAFLVEYRGEGARGGNECNDDQGVKLCLRRASCKCFDARNNTFDCVRRVSPPTVDDVYCRFADGEAFEEYYDLRTDPYQMDNMAGLAESEEQERILDCLAVNVRQEKAVDECFEPYAFY